MDRQVLEDRAKEIKSAVDQSMANHNALVGRLAEVNHMISLLPVEAANEAVVVGEVIE